MRRSTFSKLIVVAIAGTMLVGTLGAPVAHAADDPLAQIKNTINKDRQKACKDALIDFPSFHYSGDRLEPIAQAYARSEKAPTGAQAGYANVTGFLGAGEPEAQAINRAYQHGAGKFIGNCNVTEYGVGFVRHDDRHVDVVTIVFGQLPSVPSSGKPPIILK